MPWLALSRWTQTPSRWSCTRAPQIRRCFRSIALRGRTPGSTPGTCGDVESFSSAKAVEHQKPLSVVITAGQRGGSPQFEPVLEAIPADRVRNRQKRGSLGGRPPRFDKTD